jgi:hypothetical protein
MENQMIIWWGYSYDGVFDGVIYIIYIYNIYIYII